MPNDTMRSSSLQENDEPGIDPQKMTLELLEHGDIPTAPRVGDIISGSIIARKTAAVFIDLGPQGTGIIYGREFFLAHDILKKHGVGDEIHAKVVSLEHPDGYIELSVSEAGREMAWEAIKLAMEGKETLTVTVDAANRGGLMATLHGLKAFIPVSQLSSEHYPHVEGGDKEKILSALRDFINTPLRVKVLSFDPHSDKLILSERAVVEEELREELKNYQIGDTVEGSIASIADFGLFIRFGSDEKFEGLAHISELSWTQPTNVKESFTVGQRIKAKIIDMQNGRTSLSLRALTPKPEAQKTETVTNVAEETAEKTPEALGPQETAISETEETAS